MLEDAQAVICSVGRRIAELRRLAGLTQEQFAERAGVSVRYLRRVETGEENLTLGALVGLANLLGVRVADLLVQPAAMEIRRGRPPRAKAPASSPPKPGAAPAGSASCVDEPPTKPPAPTRVGRTRR